MIKDIFTTAGIILAGALLYAAVQQSSCLPRLTYTLGNNAARAALKKYEQCEDTEPEPVEPYVNCIRQLIEQLDDLVMNNEFYWSKCKQVIEDPKWMECELYVNLRLHKLEIPFSVYNHVKNGN